MDRRQFVSYAVLAFTAVAAALLAALRFWRKPDVTPDDDPSPEPSPEPQPLPPDDDFFDDLTDPTKKEHFHTCRLLVPDMIEPDKGPGILLYDPVFSAERLRESTKGPSMPATMHCRYLTAPKKLWDDFMRVYGDVTSQPEDVWLEHQDNDFASYTKLQRPILIAIGVAASSRSDSEEDLIVIKDVVFQCKDFRTQPYYQTTEVSSEHRLDL